MDSVFVDSLLGLQAEAVDLLRSVRAVGVLVFVVLMMRPFAWMIGVGIEAFKALFQRW